MAGGPNDLAEEQPEVLPVGEPRAPGRRSRSLQKADLERTLKEGADAFKFRTLIEGVRSEPEEVQAEAAAVPAPPAEAPEPAEAPSGGRFRLTRVLWIAAAALVAVLMGMQVIVLYLLLARGQTPESGQTVQLAAPVPPVYGSSSEVRKPVSGAPTRIARSPSPHRKPSRQARAKLRPLTAEDGFDYGFVRGAVAGALSGLVPWPAVSPRVPAVVADRGAAQPLPKGASSASSHGRRSRRRNR